MDDSVINRVREVMVAAAIPQAAFAERVGLTPDKLSKSLRGTRRFTSLDLARVAEAGGTTVDWLLSGREARVPDFAARATAPLDAPADRRTLEDILRRFTTAYEVLDLMGRSRALLPLPGPRTDLHRYVDQGAALAADALAVLAEAGAGPVAERETPGLIDLLERHFGIDVAQTELPDGLHGAAWQADDFRLVLLARTPVWTRQRFTLAHELGHILARDARDILTDTSLAPGRQGDPAETRANVFAANLLMPEAEVRAALTDAPGPATASESTGPDIEGFRHLVVRFKVSPSAMAARLHQLGLITPGARDRLRRLTTEVCHALAGEEALHHTRAAAARATRLPPVPARGLWEGYREGETTLRPLASYLGLDPDVLREAVEPGTFPTSGIPGDVEKGDPIFQP